MVDDRVFLQPSTVRERLLKLCVEDPLLYLNKKIPKRYVELKAFAEGKFATGHRHSHVISVDDFLREARNPNTGLGIQVESDAIGYLHNSGAVSLLRTSPGDPSPDVGWMFIGGPMWVLGLLARVVRSTPSGVLALDDLRQIWGPTDARKSAAGELEKDVVGCNLALHQLLRSGVFEDCVRRYHAASVKFSDIEQVLIHLVTQVGLRPADAATVA